MKAYCVDKISENNVATVAAIAPDDVVLQSHEG